MYEEALPERLTSVFCLPNGLTVPCPTCKACNLRQDPKLVLGKGAGPALPVFLACINRGEFCKALSTSSEVKCGRGATKQNKQQHQNEKKERITFLKKEREEKREREKKKEERKTSPHAHPSITWATWKSPHGPATC